MPPFYFLTNDSKNEGGDIETQKVFYGLESLSQWLKFLFVEN